MKAYQKIQKNDFGQSVGMTINQASATHFLATTLQGQAVTLHYLDGGNLTNQWVNQIWDTVCSEPNQSCWTYLPYSGFESKEQLAKNLQHNFNFPESKHFLIEMNHKVVGWLALMNQRAEHHAIEIGNVYFSHLMKKSRASTEVIYLLLNACFEQGFRRVEWKCDDLNLPSKNAAIRFGFSFEGVFRQDRISKGRNRNTAWYSILDEEWPAVALAYQAWLSTDNFNEQGQQKLRLQDFQKQYV